MSSRVRLNLLPSARCLFDDPLHITVTGLTSHQEVVLRASSSDEKGTRFSSWAVYRANHTGQVDLTRDVALRGSYSGVQPMGLFCFMRPHIPHAFFVKNQALSPNEVKLSVHDGDLLLAQETNQRCMLGNGVQRQMVTEADFTGVLFTPPGPGPFPAVLDICSFLSERRACLLANKGFVVLTVPVYGAGVKTDSEQLHLDPYEKAVLYLLSHAKVGSAEVGVMGRSKGAEVALSVATFVKGVGATVWLNGCFANTLVPLFYRGKQILSALLPDLSKCMRTSSDTLVGKYVLPIPRSKGQLSSVIPVEKASSRFLFVASEDDLSMDSGAHMEQVVERLKLHGKNNFETITYPGAGHLLEPPFSPFIANAFHYVAKISAAYGGETLTQAAAELHLWKKIEEFFRANLRCEVNQAKGNWSEANQAKARLE